MSDHAQQQAIQRANELLAELIGRRACITYRAAYRRILGDPPEPWHQAAAGEVLAIAMQTRERQITREISGRLDTLIVRADDPRIPGGQHFETAGYDEETWRAEFGHWPIHF